MSIRTADEAIGVRDDIPAVQLGDNVIEVLTIDTGRTSARLEVKGKGGMRDEGPVATPSGALVDAGPMDRRTEVDIEIVLGLKDPLA